MIYLASITISLGVTLWLSKFFLTYVDPSMFIDRPTIRKLHDNPVPRYGGIVFGLTILVVGAYLVGDINPFLWYFVGGFGLFILGSIDDYWTLSWKIKLPVQLAIGIFIALYFINDITAIVFFGHTLTIPLVLLIGIYLFWFIGIVNAVNLIDGMDGLAGGFMLLTCFSALIIGWINEAHVFILINSIYLGAMIGFLHFNQKPAKFFMGDTGSLLLGFHLAVLPLLFIKSTPLPGSIINITPVIILTSYLIIDTARVFFVRVRKRKNPLEPDMNHLHHIMYKSSGSYNGTILTIFLLLAISGITAILEQYLHYNDVIMFLYLIFLAGFIFIVSVTTVFVKLITKVIHKINQNSLEYKGKLNLFRIRFIPFLSLLYFISIIINIGDLSFMSSSAPLIVIGFGSLLLYIFFSPKIERVTEILIIAISIFQGIILLQINNAAGSDLTYFTFQLLRYTSFGLLAVITIFNYVINSKNLAGEFWSVVDLLVVFILLGLSSLHTIGFGIPVITGFELGVIYFANKLYAPRIFWQKAMATEIS